MATQTRTHNHFFYMYKAVGAWSGDSKQLGVRESGIEREAACQGTLQHKKGTIEIGKDNKKASKKKSMEGVCYVRRRRRRTQIALGRLATITV